MKNCLKRLKNDYLELSNKYERLNLYLVEKKEQKEAQDHEEYINLMEEQLGIMSEYLDCLYQEIKYLSKKINN